MDIDLTILRTLEREKEISFEILVEAIEQALLTAYHKTPGAVEEARVELDRKTGHVTVFAAELDDEGNKLGEYDDTPEGFGRIAATTAKQIMLQRLRDAEDDIRYGEFSGKEGDLISGVIQQGRNPDDVMVDLGKLEALLPLGERVPGESYQHGERIKCLVISVRKGMRGPQITLSRSHPNLVKKLFALEVPEIADGTVEIAAIAREAGHRTKIAVHSTACRRQRQGLVHRADGAAGAQRDVGAPRREDRHRRLLRGAGRVRRERPLAGSGDPGRRRRRRGEVGPRRRARLPAVAGHRQGGPERPSRRPPDRLADRHPLRRGMRLLGVLGGMSWTSTETYYRLLNTGVAERLGGLHSARLVLHSVDFDPIASRQHDGDWAGTAEILAEAARGLRAAGAEALLLATNTMHKVAPEIEDASALPLLHIADATAAAIRERGLSRVGLLGTGFTMNDSFLVDRLAERGVEAVVPSAAGREDVHRIIYDELVRDVVRPESREVYRQVMADLVAAGVDGMILGCTEINLLVGADDTTVPVFDSTALHAAAAVDWLLSPTR